MKKLNLKQNSLLAVLSIMIVIFTGCSKDVRYITNKISKEGMPTLENIVEIHNKYSQYDILSGGDPKYQLKNNYNYTGELTKEALEKTYRLSFYINLDDMEGYQGFVENGVTGIVLLPCDSKLEYDDYQKYPAYDGVQHIEYPIVEKYTYGVYFKIEDLEELGYIAKDRDKQKDLCLFEKERTGGMRYEHHFSSNRLIYTKEEINAVMDEYEALR